MSSTKLFTKVHTSVTEHCRDIDDTEMLAILHFSSGCVNNSGDCAAATASRFFESRRLF